MAISYELRCLFSACAVGAAIALGVVSAIEVQPLLATNSHSNLTPPGIKIPRHDPVALIATPSGPSDELDSKAGQR